MSDKTYTPAELRAQIEKMWLRQYPEGPTDQNWIFNVGLGAGMLSVAADRIERLEALLRELIDIEGPQPGHVEWYREVKAALVPQEPT